MAAVDMFLKLDGVDGESADDKHKSEIELESWSWGATNAGTAASGGGSGSGKVKVADFVVTKHIDKASPKLMEACNTGKHIGKAILTCRKAGGGQNEYLKVTLSDVLVSGFTTTGCPAGKRTHSVGRSTHAANVTTSRSNTQHNISFEGETQLPVPLEQISLNFGKIEFEYREQDSKGGMKGPVKTVWDVKGNKAS